jgi:hypothetical protein
MKILLWKLNTLERQLILRDRRTDRISRFPQGKGQTENYYHKKSIDKLVSVQQTNKERDIKMLTCRPFKQSAHAKGELS